MESEESQPEEYDEQALYKFVDVNLANHCLKVLVLILQAKKKDMSYIRKHVTKEILSMLTEYKNECEDTKLKDILAFILSNFEESSSSLAVQVGSSMQSDQQIPQSTAPAEDKKDKLKKRQNKLMKKMKTKGSKYLQDKKTTDEPEPASQESDYHQCAFCQE